jgi:hypothetical protein
MPKEVLFEVRFRGANSYEAEKRPLDTHHARLLAYKPSDTADYETTRELAEQRYEALVNAGIAKTEVDGIVPFVVELNEVTYNELGPKFGKREKRSVETVAWQYARKGDIRNEALKAA